MVSIQYIDHLVLPPFLSEAKFPAGPLLAALDIAADVAFEGSKKPDRYAVRSITEIAVERQRQRERKEREKREKMKKLGGKWRGHAHTSLARSEGTADVL